MFESLIRSHDAPSTIEGWLTTSDLPQLIFHSLSFDNATLLTVTWCHSFMDGMSLAGLLTAISCTLNGKEKEIQHLVGVNSDPLLPLGRNSRSEAFVLQERLISGVSAIRFGINMAFGRLCNRKRSLRQICVPRSHVHRILRNAVAENHDHVFISESDIIFAWWVKTLVMATGNRSSTRTIAFLNILDIRPLVQQDLLPDDKVYIANAIFPIFTILLRQKIQVF